MTNPHRIAVVGPGIVGVPMAALLAHAAGRNGATWNHVTVVQRPSPTSGWKVDAINAGKSPIGGVEPRLDAIVAESVARGTLSASHDPAAIRDADVVLVCVQTDKRGLAPEYGPLMDALGGVATALQGRDVSRPALIVIESTLAPSTMQSIIRPFFERYGLRDGHEVLLANSPNRVMPGRLVERVSSSDKLVAGLRHETAAAVASIYGHIVTEGDLLVTSSLTAEVVKTLENAYRDVRIAFATEIARYCDEQDIDFFRLRDLVNERLASSDGASADGGAVPSGAMLVPTVGVGGHCLPKDGILLWWRALEASQPSAHSLILHARVINDASPDFTARLTERVAGPVRGRRVAVLGAAYRFDSEDTRNSPALPLARALLTAGADVVLHDPHVPARDATLAAADLTSRFTNDLSAALHGAPVIVLATAHRAYRDALARFRDESVVRTVIDACNLLARSDFTGTSIAYAGIGRGANAPDPAFVEHVARLSTLVSRGVSNEVTALCTFLSDRYADDAFARVDVDDVRRFAATCTTGCDLVEPGPIEPVEPWGGFTSALVRLAGAAPARWATAPAG